jgi:ATP-dependent DNA ligase
VTPERKVRLFGGRNGSEYTGQVPYLEEAVGRVLPQDTFIDGELLSPKGHGAIQSSMTTTHAHRPSEALPELFFAVFDITRVQGIDIRSKPWGQRRRLVEAVGLEYEPLLRLSLLLPNDRALEIALNAGAEGVVYKQRNSAYVNGRSSTWVKVKPQETAEAIVVGFKPGEGSFAGMVGALEFALLDGGVHSRCSGFNMATRQDITDHPDRWLGTVIEIKHHGISKDGKPRHPQFLRRRDDRDVVQAVVEQQQAKAPPKERSGRMVMRNYKAMGDDKLARCRVELRTGEGDAFDKCVLKGGDPREDLKAVEAELLKRGLLGR